MINEIIKNTIRFFLLLFIQVLVVKNMELGRFILPFVYVLFILMLPFETPSWIVLILSFLLGLTIDVFYDTLGMHAAACVFMGFVRPTVLKIFSPREGYEFGMQPTIQYLGVPWFLSYTTILIFFHHFILFFSEVFRFSEFFSTLFRIILSTLATLLLVVLSQFLFYKNKQQ